MVSAASGIIHIYIYTVWFTATASSETSDGVIYILYIDDVFVCVCMCMTQQYYLFEEYASLLLLLLLNYYLF